MIFLNLKKDIKNDKKKKTVTIIRMLVIFFNSIDQNINESYQLKNKDEQKDEKQVPTYFEN